MLDATTASALNKIIENSHFKREDQSRRTAETKKRIGFYEEDRSLSWSTSTFEWLALMIQDWITPIYSVLLFMMTTFRNSIQNGTKFHCRCQKFHPMTSWKSLYKLRIRESDQLKRIGLRRFILCYSSWWQHSGIRYKMGRSSIVDVKNSIQWYLGKSVKIEDTWVSSTQNCARIVRHGDSQEDIGSQLSKVENHGEEEYRSETSITKLWRQTRENWIRSSGQESKVISWRWKRERYLSPVERKRPLFARRPLQFPPLNPRSCAKTRPHCRHTFWTNRITRSKCVEEEEYPRQK